MIEWVVIWVTSNSVPPAKFSSGDACWLMVRHKQRGWELPGGSLEVNETVEAAVHRELFEETGLVGEIQAISDNCLDGGFLAWVVVDKNPSSEFWKSHDASIEEVGWWMELPESPHWGVDEIAKCADYWYLFNNS
ncbi:MAG: NUDIX domain-containing protein [Candidatus Thalassarchaeaceae archaeon]|jgi:8-oxo-dGTP pyrophosphatase MutT (NUDIX family)|nr:NUDIX domain-containing protein [Candidatus Thalassarchaeaceae archaeon]